MARRPAPETPALIDARVLLAAAVLVAPAVYRASQGLLTLDQVLTRYLFLALGCTVALAVGRGLWPLLAGTDATTGGTDDNDNNNDSDNRAAGGADETSPAATTAAVSPPPG